MRPVWLLVCSFIIVSGIASKPRVRQGQHGDACLPLGPAYLTSRYRDVRIVQTPTLVVMA